MYTCYTLCSSRPQDIPQLAIVFVLQTRDLGGWTTFNILSVSLSLCSILGNAGFTTYKLTTRKTTRTDRNSDIGLTKPPEPSLSKQSEMSSMNGAPGEASIKEEVSITQI